MTSKQFNAFVRFVIHDIMRIADMLEDGKAKDELLQLVDRLRAAV